MKNAFRLALFLFAFAFGLAAPAPAQMMGHKPPVPMSPQQFAQAVPGQSIQIAVRIIRMNRSTLYAELLQHKTETTSKATGKHVMLYLPGGTPVVMGTAKDIVPGAVLFVYGVLTKPGNVDVKQAVIDTRFVKVS